MPALNLLIMSPNHWPNKKIFETLDINSLTKLKDKVMINTCKVPKLDDAQGIFVNNQWCN